MGVTMPIHARTKRISELMKTTGLGACKDICPPIFLYYAAFLSGNREKATKFGPLALPNSSSLYLK
jgi:hypothetical protein